MLNIQTSHWNRLSILQSHSQQGTAGNVSEPLLFHQEFHKSHKMIIGLFLKTPTAFSSKNIIIFTAFSYKVKPAFTAFSE